MERVLFYLKTVPDYLDQQFNEHMAICVAILAIYLFTLVFTNKVADFLRPFVVAACIGFTIYGAFAGIGGHGLQAMMTGVLALIILIIFRIIKGIIVSSYQNRVNAKIEQKALEKAAKRRGSEHHRPKADMVPAPAPEKRAAKASANSPAPSESPLVDYYTETLPDISAYLEQEKAAAKQAAAAPRPAPVPQPAASPELTGPRLGREEVYDLLAKLTALYDAQILTGDEFEAKKLLLLKRI